MKKFITLLSAAIIFTNICNAQFKKGSILLGGDLGFNTTSSTYTTTANPKDHYNNFYFTPSFAKAVKTNLFVGVYAGLNYYKTTQINYPSYNKQYNYSYGFLVRQYKTIKGGFSLYLQGNLGGHTNRVEMNLNTPGNYANVQKSQGISLSANPGISYQVSSKLQIETGLQSLFSIDYSNINYTSNDPQYTGYKNQKSFAFNSTINNFTSQLYFGFRFLLQKK